MINLESYLIPAEEAVIQNGEVVVTDEARAVLTKINRFSKAEKLAYCNLSELVEGATDLEKLEKLTSADLKILHKCFYNEELAIDYFGASTSEDIAQIKKYQPIPIDANGMGDFFCLTGSGQIKEYIHDAPTYFDAKYARNYSNFSQWLNGFYKKHNS